MGSAALMGDPAATESPPVKASRFADVPALAALSAAWWAGVALVGPHGDFPLNDDWGYAPAVRALVDEGALRFTDWQSMPLITHVLWGWLFAAPAGFSHDALRLSTLVLGWLGVLAMYALLRQLKAPRFAAGVGAALLLVNPLYFGLAFSFMTDVPFTAVVIAASAAWLRAEQEESRGWLAVATLLALWATLNRQLGIALPMAWTLVSLLRHGPRSPRWFRDALVPAAIVIGALLVYQKVIEATVGLPTLYAYKTEELTLALGDLARGHGLRAPAGRSLLSLLYLGLFTLPLSATIFRALERGRLSRILPLLGACVGALLAGNGLDLPLTGNVWLDLGMGPRTAPGIVGPASPKIGIVITTVAGLGAGFFLHALVRGAQRAGLRVDGESLRALPRQIWDGLRSRVPRVGEVPAWAWLFLLLAGAISFAPTSIVYGAFFDRYLLLQLPFAIALVWAACVPREARGPGRWVALAALVGAFAYSVAATHDYMGWQRARWEGVALLETRGVGRDQIRGGFEVDNRAPEAQFVSRPKAPYAVALAPLHDHETVAVIEVDAWLPAAVERVYVLRQPKRLRDEGASTP